MTAAHNRCTEFVKEIYENINTVKYLVDAINKLNSDQSPQQQQQFSLDKFKCVSSRQMNSSSASSISATDNNSNNDTNNYNNNNSNPSPPVQQAGYMWQNSKFAKKGEIILLEDMLREKDDVERAMRHELVHAYDDARGEIEPTNCYHHACSEVRAARLSGDCFIGEELKRGRVGTISGRDCVMRRATLAVENSPLCRGFGARSVEVVLPRCYRDFEPFVAPPYVMGNAKGYPQ